MRIHKSDRGRPYRRSAPEIRVPVAGAGLRALVAERSVCGITLATLSKDLSSEGLAIKAFIPLLYNTITFSLYRGVVPELRDTHSSR